MGMISDRYNELLKNGYLTIESLSRISKINENDLEKYMLGNYELSLDDISRLTMILGMLCEGMQLVEDDDRINAIIDVLKDEYKMDNRSISYYVGITQEKLELFIDKPSEISFEDKYKIAVRVSILNYFFK